MKTLFFAFSISLGLSSTLNAAEAELFIGARFTAPMIEISGASHLSKTLYLVSDHTQEILTLPFAPDTPQTLDLVKTERIAPKSKQKLSKTSQWEAIAVDGAKKIFTVKETDSEIYSLAADGKVLETYTLAPANGKKHKSKGFEGLVLLKGSHFLLAQSKPSVLVEYGPRGEKALGVSPTTVLSQNESFSPPPAKDLVPLAQWRMKLPKSCQFGEITRDKDAVVFALLKDCSKIVKIPPLDPAQQDFETTESFSIPSEIDHAEGLISLDTDGFLVAIDQRSIKPNVFWLTRDSALKAK